MNDSAGTEKYSMEDFVSIMHKLRAPGGCPWDMEQTHESIRRDFLEECYEAVEAIDAADSSMLREELGDVLMQVVFHSVIEEEKGAFDFDDVVNDISKKMIVRHPHVFSDTVVNNVDELLTNWDNIKKETKGQKTDKEALASVSRAMPALMRGQKIQKKAAKLGVVRYADPKQGILQTLNAKTSFDAGDIGSLLSMIIALAEQCSVDAEKSLYDDTDQFIETNF